MARRLIIPHQVEHMLLYGTADWIERELPQIVVPVSSLCAQLRIRPAQLQEALEWLRVNGILQTYEWRSSYFTVSLVPPVGMRMSITKEIAYE